MCFLVKACDSCVDLYSKISGHLPVCLSTFIDRQLSSYIMLSDKQRILTLAISLSLPLGIGSLVSLVVVSFVSLAVELELLVPPAALLVLCCRPLSHLC